MNTMRDVLKSQLSRQIKTRKYAYRDLTGADRKREDRRKSNFDLSSPSGKFFVQSHQNPILDEQYYRLERLTY